MDNRGLCGFDNVLSYRASLLRRLNLEIRTDGISYTSLFGPARFVAFSEISTVVLIDYRHASSQAYPSDTPFTWTALIRPNVETGKPVLRIPLSLFSVAVYREMQRLFKPEIWAVRNIVRIPSSQHSSYFASGGLADRSSAIFLSSL